MMSRLLLLSVIVTLFVLGKTEAVVPTSNTSTGRIVVKVAGIRKGDGGNLIVSLYNSKDDWLDTGQAGENKILPVEDDSAFVAFEDLPYDSIYAIAVIHDRNMNGKLDMRRFPWPKPKEGAGVSNNRFGFGPPDYKSARLRLSGPVLRVRIELRY